MAFWNRYPYMDMNQLNLDWILSKLGLVDKAKVDAEAAKDAAETAQAGAESAQTAAAASQTAAANSAATAREAESNTYDLYNRIGGTVAPQVTAWLNENVNPAGSAVAVDASLTISGAAADAKVTGDNITSLKEFPAAVADSMRKGFTEDITLVMRPESVILNSTGQIFTASSLTGFEVSNLTEITGNSFYLITASTQYLGNIYYALYDENENVLVKSETGGSAESFINKIIYAPPEAKYIAVAKSPNYPRPTLTGMGGEINVSAALEIGYHPVDFETIPRSIVSPSWTIADAGSFNYFIASIPVTGQKTVRITSATEYGNPKWAWRNSSGGIISLEPAGGSGLIQTNKQVVNVPDGASELLVNGLASRPVEIELIDTTIKRKWLGKKWALIGDSLTNYNQRTYKHYFTYIKWLTGIDTINYGVSDTGYAKGINNNNAFYQVANTIDTDYDVITIFGSFNDLATGMSLGSVTDATNTTIAGCINMCIDWA